MARRSEELYDNKANWETILRMRRSQKQRRVLNKAAVTQQACDEFRGKKMYGWFKDFWSNEISKDKDKFEYLYWNLFPNSHLSFNKIAFECNLLQACNKPISKWYTFCLCSAVENTCQRSLHVVTGLVLVTVYFHILLCFFL